MYSSLSLPCVSLTCGFPDLIAHLHRFDSHPRENIPILNGISFSLDVACR